MPFTDFGSWVCEEWQTQNGRVTLAGDGEWPINHLDHIRQRQKAHTVTAAHAMTPYRGQGLNHAIQDASNFVHAMRQLHDCSEASQKQGQLVQAYSDEVAKRGAEEVRLSRKNGEMLIGYHDFMNSPYAKQGLSKQQ